MDTTTTTTATAAQDAASVSAAREAHAAAVANADAAKRRASRADAAHRQALADQQGVIGQAAAGKPVKQPEIIRAATAVAEAKDALDYASLVARGAVALTEGAEVDLLRAQAAKASANHTAAIHRLIARAAEVDEAFAALQKTIIAYDDAVGDVGLAAGAIHTHNQVANYAKARNSTLAKLEPGDVPTCRTVGHVRSGQVRAAFISEQDGSGGYLLAKPGSIAGRLRSGFGLPPDGTST